MNLLRTKLGFLAAAIAVLALPSAAAAENLVPPDNSAVNQYTESFPTAGGDKDSEKAKKAVTPAQTLGAKNAKRLEAHGDEGRVVAEVAAETAPVPTGTEASAPLPAPEGDDDKGDPSGKNRKDKQPQKDAEPVSQGGGGGGGSPGGGTTADGSSGLGEVLGQATGTSGGQLGLLLPLVLLGSLAWALAFLWRRRNQTTV